jgi:hypothetical protein
MGDAMKAARPVVTIALLLFVSATVGTLIAQEVARPEAQIIGGSGPLAAGAETVSLPAASGEDVADGEETALEDELQPPPDDTANVEQTLPAEGDKDATSTTAESAEAAACVVDAIYFHNTHRCWTCQKIEGDAKAIVETEFADHLAAGTLRWSAINMEEQRQYVSRYQLTQPTLVLVRTVGSEPQDWLALSDTWTLIRSAAKFSTYIENSLRVFLAACP